MTAFVTSFVQSQSAMRRAALVPEIDLHLAHDPHLIFREVRDFNESHPELPVYPPYWAFAWPGGQAMARHILDTPTLIEGLRIADIGAGSGIASIAAIKAGAAHVFAVDVDPLAAAAIALNAEANGVAAAIDISTEDCLGEIPSVDMILISDLVYEPELAVRVGAFLERVLAAGLPVIIGDRLTARCPARGFVEVARYDAPLTPALDDDDAELGRIWHCRPRRRGTPRAPRTKATP
ncbi:MAG: methyltransferase [Hyphomicrobiaceae bacterium]